MLSLVRTDVQTLPSELLGEVKEHLRVTFTRDDSYIRGCTGRAIAEVESVTNISINPAQYKWTPCREQQDLKWSRYRGRYTRIPKFPVRRLQLAGKNIDMICEELAFLVCDADANATYILDVGYATESQILPAVRNPILMLTGALYEQREAVQQGTFTELPDMARRLMSGVWIPSV